MGRFGALLLAVGLMCMALAGWSLIQGRVRDAIFGVGLGIFLVVLAPAMMAAVLALTARQTL
jgi:hypothetical protein